MVGLGRRVGIRVRETAESNQRFKNRNAATATHYKSLNMNKAWRIWCKAMGEKISDEQHENDIAALIRSVLYIVTLISGILLIANVIHHW